MFISGSPILTHATKIRIDSAYRPVASFLLNTLVIGQNVVFDQNDSL